MKKLLNLALALVMLIVQIVPVNAETNQGSITITGAIEGQTYSVYHILDLESYDESRNAYTYKSTTEWSSFINKSGIKGTYVDVDDQGYVTWIEGADVVAFSKAALEHAKTNNLTKKEDTPAAGSTTVEFTNLKLGYYLVDSSLGALCGLTTAKPSARVIEKNSETTMVKEVKEGNNWGIVSDAKIGDEVLYKTTITVSSGPDSEEFAGAENYVLYDKMSEGLTFNDNIVVTLNTTDSDDKPVSTELEKGTHYTVDTDNNDYTYIIDFVKTFEDTLKLRDTIVVTYSATLNEKAVMYDNTNSDPEKNTTGANTNVAKLVYGDENEISSTTKTYSFTFDLIKLDQDRNLLTGATFRLYDSKENGNEIEVVLVDAATNTYRVATEDETGVKIDLTQIATAKIKGLNGNTTYYLEEVDAPAGYNRLPERVNVSITDKNLDAKFTEEEVEETTTTTITGGVQVTNTKGKLLPTTGGVGTVIFISVGSIMVLGFGLLLVAKLRLSKEDI